MPAEICRGNTFYAEIPQGETPHLFFVMTDPFGEPPAVITVNISTLKGIDTEDRTTVLDVGDHPFINRKSYIAYDYARKLNVDIILKRLEKGLIELRDDVEETVFNRILEGLYESRRTPDNIKHACRKNNPEAP